MTASDQSAWAGWLACPVCPARKGDPCYQLTSGGPKALPAVPAAAPHSSRKRSATGDA